MKNLPHEYRVKVEGSEEGDLTTHAERLPILTVAPPIQFDGPGNQWSPEDLLMASVANCLVLSFKAIAKASKLNWNEIECESVGELDKVERKVQFTRVLSKVRLSVPKSVDIEKAERLLLKAEEACLVSNSLSCETGIEYKIIHGGA